MSRESSLAIEQAREEDFIRVRKADLVAAWSVLENLTSSLCKIGSTHGQPVDAPPDAAVQQQMLEALDDYLTPELLRGIAWARRCLVEYLPDQETEELSERVIPYWNYQAFKNKRVSGQAGSPKEK